MHGLMRAMCGLAVACTLGFGAQAQTLLPVTPQKLALAQQLVEVSGAKKTSDMVMMAMFKRISTSLSPNLNTPEDKAFLANLIQDEFAKTSSKALASSAQIYAQTFTDQELRDIVTFYQSASGRSFVDKIPDVLLQTSVVTEPLIPQLQKDMLDRIFDYVCKKQKCTPEQVKKIEAAKAQALLQYQQHAQPVAAPVKK